MDFPGKDRLPKLGVGLSFRSEIAQAIYDHLHELDFVELILDNALRGTLHPDFHNIVLPRMPLLGHGVNSSIGSLEPIDTDYLHAVKDVARQMGCLWFSDHLAFTRSKQMDIGQLMPIQFTEETIDFLGAKIRAINAVLEVPFLIENIPYYFTIPGSTMTEVEFVIALLEAGRCGLLLDVNNLYANATNHGFDPYEFIDRLPFAAVTEIHIAGGERHNDLYIDTHGQALNPEVLALLDYAVATKRPNAILLEREKNFPPMQELVGELRLLRQVWSAIVRRTRCAAAS